MASTKKVKNLFDHRIDILKKLKSMDIHTEKEIQKLSFEDLLDGGKNFSVNDLRDMLQAKRHIKAGNLFSWLCEESLKEEAKSELGDNENLDVYYPQYSDGSDKSATNSESMM